MPVLGDLGGQLAQRWVGRLALPGLLLAATALVGAALGQRQPFDHARLLHRVARCATSFAARPPSVQLLLTGAVLLAVAAVGVAVESAAGVTLLHQYGLDLAAVWPRLWLVLPQEARDEVTAARRRVEAAAQLATWAVPFAAVPVLWWPAWSTRRSSPGRATTQPCGVATSTNSSARRSWVAVQAPPLTWQTGPRPG
ncbi:hypothetical protein [Streptomyces sp. NPDC004296]|uniref:hypothetical protein n=1 Tax=Streptomyces sp. NPDC004296 TaxID=3364697 RepID=UPI0036C8309E